MAETHHGARYENIVVDGKVLEAVFRIQEAQSEKACESEGCVLNTRVLPMQKYARVFYRDTNVVEIFHVACFGKEFGIDARY